LFIIGVVLLVTYAGIRLDGFLHYRSALRAFHAQQGTSGVEIAGKRLSMSSPVDFTLWSPERIKGYEDSLHSNLQAPVAVLRIPKIRLEVPVLEGTDDLTLNRAVGHIVGTARPLESGNIGIAGHRDGFFRGLKDISSGDVLELQTAAGNASYSVDEIEIVEPSDSSVLLPRNKPSITLVTCYPFYFIGSAPNRFIVHASLKNASLGATAQVASDHATAKNENNQETNQ
jgi:sortase A